MNQKDLRIQALAKKGMSAIQIARKIGYGNPPSRAGIERVLQALNRRES